MPVTDPISDMFTRIRNGARTQSQAVEMPASKLKLRLAEVLRNEGFISSFETKALGSPEQKLRIVLKYGRKSEDRYVRSLHGLSRTLVANMVKGVTDGFSRNLEIVGVGYRAAVEGKKLIMQLGYSHPVEIPFPAGTEITVDKKATTITVS